MLTFYSVPVSLYCAKLRILLRHKQLEYREISPPGGYGSDEYKNVVPSGNLPSLTDGNNTIGDSEAIAEYLEEVYSTPAMLPDDPLMRAKVRELSRFHDTRLEPEIRKLFPHVSPLERSQSLIEIQVGAIQSRLGQLAKMLETNSVSSGLPLTLADCGFPVTFAWLDVLAGALDMDLEWPETLTRYRQRLTEASAVAEEMADYEPKLAAWLEERISP